jgi:hypothetical protein
MWEEQQELRCLYCGTDEYECSTEMPGLGNNSDELDISKEEAKVLDWFTFRESW